MFREGHDFQSCRYAVNDVRASAPEATSYFPDRIFHIICRNTPSQTCTSRAGILSRFTNRRTFSSVEAAGFTYPLVFNAPISEAVNRSTSPDTANSSFSDDPAA